MSFYKIFIWYNIFIPLLYNFIILIKRIIYYDLVHGYKYSSLLKSAGIILNSHYIKSI